MNSVRSPRGIRGTLRRHRVLTTAASAAIIAGLALAGTTGCTDTRAVAAIVEQATTTEEKISSASGVLVDLLSEARALSDLTVTEVADPADHAELLTAIEAAETVASGTAVTATASMALDEAEAAHAAALLLLADLESAPHPLRAAIDKATTSRASYLAAALTEAKARHTESQTALAQIVAAAEQALVDSEGKVSDDGVRVQLRSVLDRAQEVSQGVPDEAYTSFHTAAAQIDAVGAEVTAASNSLVAAVDAKAAADAAAAEKAAAERAAQETAAAQKPVTSAPSKQEGSGGGSAYYKNCAAARAAGAAPVYRGDPGYAKHLDRDGDGIGCE